MYSLSPEDEQEVIFLPPWEQPDGSIVDMYGRRMSIEDRLNIISVIEGLPVTEKKDLILNAINHNPITIIEWATGSGKTTQIPKWLAESTGFREQIIVTQPRVFVTRANANRVSQELLAEYGDPSFSLGYKIGYRTGRGVSSPRTSPLSFHTDALELMRQLVSNKVPKILVLDEVHNFSVPTEVLAMYMRLIGSRVRLIIMSATLDPNIFKEYYRSVSTDIPVIQVPGRTYPVNRSFVDEASWIASIKWLFEQKKNILVFVAGKKEIKDTISKLQKELGERIPIFPLHADLAKEEQEFLLTNTTGKPRIIVTTNVAEESVTINYADAEVDFWKHKVSSYNSFGIPMLCTENISQANANQRAWRVGRTHIWEAVYANDTPFGELAPFPEAPIEREMIDRYILQCLAQGIDITQLQKEHRKRKEPLFFHEFDAHLLQISMKRLHQIGAINREGVITPLGMDLLQFPVDIYHARMLRESIEKKCTEDIIFAVAILEKKWFLSKQDTWKKIKLPKVAEGDLFTYIGLLKIATARTLTKKQNDNLLALWISREELDIFEKAKGKHKLYEVVDLSPVDIKNKNIAEIDTLIEILYDRLKKLNIPITSSENNDDKKTCIAAGSLHTIFQFDSKEKKFYNTHHPESSDRLYFTLWDVSTIKPTIHHLYAGVPFIIGGDEEKGDFPLVTFMTPLDEGHIKSIQKGLASLSGVDRGTTGVARKLRTEDAIREYAAAIEKYERWTESNVFKTQEWAQVYYLQHCLPDFLIGHNPSVKQYLEGKSPEQIFIFRELLVGIILEEERTRIHPRSLEKTERSFAHDTTIMERFLESTNPYIEAFRKGKPLPQKEKRKFTSVEIEEQQENAELLELKKVYARLVGSIMKKLKKYNIQKLKEGAVEDFISYIVEETSEAYAILMDHYRTLGNTDSLTLSKWIQQLKRIHQKERTLKKLRIERGMLLNITENLGKLIRGEKADIELITSYEFWPEFWEKRKEQIESTLNQVQTRDKRKQQNAKVELQKLIIDLEAGMQKLDIDIDIAIKEKTVQTLSIGKEIHRSLEVLCRRFFEREYFHHVISGKLFDVTRAIVRDQQTEKKGLDNILKELLLHGDFRRSSQVGKTFWKVDEFNTLTEALETYTEEIFQTVKESQDTDVIRWYIEALQGGISLFHEKKKETENAIGKFIFPHVSEDKIHSEIEEYYLSLRSHTPKYSKKKIQQASRKMQDLTESQFIKQEERRTKRAHDIEILSQLVKEQQEYLMHYLSIQEGIQKDIQRTLAVISQKKVGQEVARGKYRSFSLDVISVILKKKQRELQEINEYVEAHENTLKTNPERYNKILEEMAIIQRRLSRK
jgi:HrpA-like RNA helicase